MQTVVDVLRERDGMSFEEAREVFNDVMDEVQMAIDEGDSFGGEEIFTSAFGLEPDYLMEALFNYS